ncbi:hypothetical protein [Ottowia testudinis]|uniref:Lipoprotein n=1 Tax=Ottowia testudinis TaxID=2816950 RepID=A0A975H4T9_9BURK|nr:hypothetical protein [Ottowia testudinis]QTD46666.1 hypothetical protein J1M35_07270 [Ottowia testudinis]
MIRLPPRALLAALLLAGCGGGSEVSWCFSDGSGAVSAGYNTTQCPPAPSARQALPAGAAF